MRYKNIETGEVALLVYTSEEKWVFINERGLRFFVEPSKAGLWEGV